MKIIIEVDCTINSIEAQEYVQYLNQQPWVKLTYIEHCKLCDKPAKQNESTKLITKN